MTMSRGPTAAVSATETVAVMTLLATLAPLTVTPGPRSRSLAWTLAGAFSA